MEGNLTGALSKGVLIPFFCIFVAIWAQLMLEYWKQSQNIKAMEWGQTEFEEEEDERPEFEQTDMVASLVDGSQVKYFSPMERTRRIRWSIFVISCMLLLVIVVVSLIFYLQFLVNSSLTGTLLTICNASVSVAQAVSIVVLNTIYSNLAEDLNNNENHRTGKRSMYIYYMYIYYMYVGGPLPILYALCPMPYEAVKRTQYIVHST
jgi:hypothetical protein